MRFEDNMPNKALDYFRRFREEAGRYEQARCDRAREKEALIAADDWDGVDAWYKREAQFANPFTPGQYKAYWAFRKSSEIELNDLAGSNTYATLVLDDFLWEKEVADFCTTLREAGVRRLIVTNQSTALMENIHQLEAAGWRLMGTSRLEIRTRRFGEETTEVQLGLRFEDWL